MSFISEQDNLEFTGDVAIDNTRTTRLHNFMDASYQQSYQWNFIDRLDVDTDYGPPRGKPIFSNTDFSTIDFRFLVSAFAPELNARRVVNGYYHGQAIQFGDLVGAGLPANISYATTYYLIPMAHFQHSTTETLEDRAYKFRLALTAQDALDGTFIVFTADSTLVAVELDSTVAEKNLQIINVPHIQAPVGQTVTARVIANAVDLGELAIDEWGRCPLGVDFANWAIVGEPYTSTIRTLDLDVGSQLGSGLEAIQRIDRIMPLIYKTKDMQFGSEDGLLDEVDFDNDSSQLETKKPIVFLPQSPDSEIRVILQSNKPFPCTILALSMRGTAYDS